ncbi:MAG: hypothetical protein PVI21_00520 [Candidatus Woesebacteria bacterium]
MLFISMFSWWYGLGWLQLMQRAVGRVGSVLDFFSVGELLKTLFSPYRQISVGQVNGPLSVKLRAWFDLQISRIIGAMIRLVVIIAGLFAAILSLILAFVLVLGWPILPVLPLIALFMAIGGGR